MNREELEIYARRYGYVSTVFLGPPTVEGCRAQVRFAGGGSEYPLSFARVAGMWLQDD